MTLLLFEAGQSDSSIILRSGRANVTTLSRYHNLQGKERKANKSVYSMAVATNLQRKKLNYLMWIVEIYLWSK